MIVTLSGKLIESTPLRIVIENQGLGYEVFIPFTTFEKLPSLNSPVKLHIYAVYREDAQTLYGFHNREDREFFRLIIEKVSGIGPKIAINILSRLSVHLLQNAIADGDISLLSQCPGIGKKTAERLIVELRDKVMPTVSSLKSSQSMQHLPHKHSLSGDLQDDTEKDVYQDAVQALITLGYKLTDADKAIRKASSKLSPEASTEALIRCALSSS